jgi:hypothetical protein
VLRRQPATKNVAGMIGLADVLPLCPDAAAVVAAVVGGCAVAWDACFLPGEIGSVELR